jgi:hypothetical protein
MSWRVEYLIKNSAEIKSKALTESLDPYSDEFNDIIILEKKLKDLITRRVISLLEIKVINLFADGNTPKDIASKLKLNRVTVSEIFNRTCEKVAFYLGGTFTDDGFATYMQDKYNLTQVEYERLIKYMEGKYKHKIMSGAKRRQINVKTK